MDKVNSVFEKFDRDENGSLSIEEVLPYFMKDLDLPYENVELLFDEIDKNHDHEISKEELFDFFIEHSVVDFTQ